MFIGFWNNGKKDEVGLKIIIFYMENGRTKITEILSEEEIINCFNSFEAKYIQNFNGIKKELKVLLIT